MNTVRKRKLLNNIHFLRSNGGINTGFNSKLPVNPFLNANVNLGRPANQKASTTSFFQSGGNALQNKNNANIGRPLSLQSNTFNSNRIASNPPPAVQRTPSISFPPLPVSSSIPGGQRTNNRINTNTIISNVDFNPNRNTNQINIDNNLFNLNNNPFISQTSTNNNFNGARNQVATSTKAPQSVQFFSTTPRPVQPFKTTPRPVQSFNKSPIPNHFSNTNPAAILAPRPTAGVINSRVIPIIPTVAPQNFFNNFNKLEVANPFQTAARLHSSVRSDSNKPSSNPFIAFNAIAEDAGKKQTSSAVKKLSKPRKSLPVRVPLGFDWPGGNGYFFRMSTGNSKPIEYFISYDN